MILINNKEKSLYMKQTIKKVLDRHKDSQGNLSSDAFRDMLAVEIESNIALLDNSHTETMVLKRDAESLAKDNPLSIEMWKGYQPEKNKDQMELKLDVETKHFADDFHEGKI